MDIRADISKLSKDMDKATKQISRGVKANNRYNKSMARNQKGMFDSAKAVTQLYVAYQGLSVAMRAVIGTGLEYNKQLEDAQATLTAMTRGSVGYVTTQNELVDAQERSVIINSMVAKSMKEIQAILPDTAMSMKDLLTNFSLMKPAMDAANVGIKDQVELLKLAANAATNFQMGANELKSGIDGLGSGIWIANSAFGRMMTALGVSKEELKNTGDVAGYLKSKLYEAGQMADTMAVATNELDESWSTMTAGMTKDIFGMLKEGAKALTHEISVNSAGAIDYFASGFVDFGKTALRVLSVVLKGISAITTALKIAWDGYKQIGNVVGMGVDKVGAAFKDNEANNAEKRGATLKAERLRAEADALRGNIKLRKELSLTIANGSQDSINGLNKLYTSMDTVQKKMVNFKRKEMELTDKVLKQNEKVIKPKAKSGGGAGKAGALRNKALKDALALDLKRAELAKAMLDLEDAKLARLITSQEAMKREIVLAKAKVAIDKKALAKAKEFASKIGGGVGADKARKKIIEAELKLTKSQTVMWKKINKELLDTAKEFKSTIESAFDSILSGDFGGAISGMFDGMIDTLVKPLKETISTAFGTAMSSMMPSGLTGSFIGIGLSLLKGLLGGKELSQAELDKAKGITEVQSESIENILSLLNKNAVKELHYSKGIFENMRLLVKQADKASVQLGGQDFNKPNSMSSGFLGFSSKTVTQLASGLEIMTTSIDDLNKSLLNARMVSKKRVQKSSFWGLFSSDKIKTSYSDVPDDVKKSIIGAYSSGLAAITNAAKAIGVDAIDELIKGFTTGTHNLNFKDKSQEEISAMISGAISKDFDTFIGSVMPMVEEFAKAGEGMLETLVRVAYEFEATENALSKIGGTLNILSDNALEVSQAMIYASGSLENLLSDISGYISNFYSDAEQQQVRQDSLLKSTAILPANLQAFKDLIDSYTAMASAGNVGAGETLANLLSNQQQYHDYYDYILQQEKKANEEKKRLQDEEMAQLTKTLDFYKGIYGKINDAYTGSLSYLNSMEKAKFMGDTAMTQLAAGDTQGYISSLYKQLEYEKKMSITKEEYMPKFDNYVDELKVQEPEKDITDVVESIETVSAKLEEVKDAIELASYQS